MLVCPDPDAGPDQGPDPDPALSIIVITPLFLYQKVDLVANQFLSASLLVWPK
jgi:hypothetical protein